MNLVYIKVSIDLLDEMKGFFRKLKRYVGDYRVEAQDVYDVQGKVVKVSFYTNKVDISEGESRQVYIEAKRNERGSWYFTSIEK